MAQTNSENDKGKSNNDSLHKFNINKIREIYGKIRKVFDHLKNSIGTIMHIDYEKVKARAGFALLSIASIIFLLSFLNFAASEGPHFTLVQNRIIRVKVSKAAEDDVLPVLKDYCKNHPEVMIENKSNPDVVIDAKRINGFQSTQIRVVPALVLETSQRKITGRKTRYYWFCWKRRGTIFRISESAIENLKSEIQNYYSGVTLRMNIVGDIIPGRHVAERMAIHGVDYPFKKIAPLTRDADIVFGDLECPLTDKIKPLYYGMTFVAPRGTIYGLKMLGLNVAGVANNHSTNYGIEPFIETIKLLKENGIVPVGGGMNYKEAHSAAVVEKNGVRISFLQYNTIEGSIDAGENSAGVAWVSMPPWRNENPEHFQVVMNDIASAKAQADFLIVCFHWSAEDVYEPNESMRKMAHMCIDAGADMVVGGHPHTVQPVEFYKGKFIAYSLGNFIFDQMQRDQTREGFFLECKFARDELTNIKMVPYKIYDYSQPRPLYGKEASKLIKKVLALSGMNEK